MKITDIITEDRMEKAKALHQSMKENEYGSTLLYIYRQLLRGPVPQSSKYSRGEEGLRQMMDIEWFKRVVFPLCKKYNWPKQNDPAIRNVIGDARVIRDRTLLGK